MTFRLPRRRFLRLAASAVAAPALSQHAFAETYPSRPIHLIIGFPPGGPTDIWGRLMAQWLSERLGQPVVVENRPGAGSNVATDFVVRSPPDGYTLFLDSLPNAINATLYDSLPYDFIRDMAPVAGIVRSPNVMEVNPDVPVRTVTEFIAYAKDHHVVFASAGVGTSMHLSGELFKMMTGIEMQHVPYRGSAPALTDLMAGQEQVMFDAMASSIAYVKSGRLRALAVTTATRSDALPDVPTVGDTVPGFDVSAWFGLGAPAKTPPEIVERLNKETNAVLADPNVKARFAELGGMTFAVTPAEFGKFIVDETEKWAKVVRLSGAKPE
jgi:tripartite-type tricarboxylate transporter receptor subunit TctC